MLTDDLEGLAISRELSSYTKMEFFKKEKDIMNTIKQKFFGNTKTPVMKRRSHIQTFKDCEKIISDLAKTRFLDQNKKRGKPLCIVQNAQLR